MGTPDHTTHARAAILVVGDELVIGQSLDTNSMWLAERLTAMGLRVQEHRTVVDDLPRVAGAIVALMARHELLIVTGGLGPTRDDLTRDALAEAFGEDLVEDERAVAWLEARLRATGRGSAALDAARRVQARRPRGAECLENPTGTAPGLHRAHETGDVFCLPGPPREMRPMFDAEVAPRIRVPEGRVVRTRLVRLCGVPESEAASRLGDLMDRARNPLVGTTASGGLVTVRIRFEGEISAADAAMPEAEAAVESAVGEFAFGADGDTLPEVVLGLLRRRGERLVVVESCTGGTLGAQLTAVPGSSDAFEGGWITYSNAMKRAAVGVPGEIVDGPPGAVSAETVAAMARGALEACARAGIGAHHALSISGVAGPGGGSDDKPVGTVWIARASRPVPGRSPASSVGSRRFHIPGDRDDVRERSATTALVMLWRALAGRDSDAPLLWERPG
jgi:nicotinamide-nucleotide amidase